MSTVVSFRRSGGGCQNGFKERSLERYTTKHVRYSGVDSPCISISVLGLDVWTYTINVLWGRYDYLQDVTWHAESANGKVGASHHVIGPAPRVHDSSSNVFDRNSFPTGNDYMTFTWNFQPIPISIRDRNRPIFAYFRWASSCTMTSIDDLFKVC